MRSVEIPRSMLCTEQNRCEEFCIRTVSVQTARREISKETRHKHYRRIPSTTRRRPNRFPESTPPTRQRVNRPSSTCPYGNRRPASKSYRDDSVCSVTAVGGTSQSHLLILFTPIAIVQRLSAYTRGRQ